MKTSDKIILGLLIAFVGGICALTSAGVGWFASQWNGTPNTVTAIVTETPSPTTVVPTATPTVTPSPTATPVVPTAVPTTSPAMPESGTRGCGVINDYNLLPDMDHVSTSGKFLHLEFYRFDGDKEYETILPTEGVPGGRYDILVPLRGHVWEYGEGCTLEEVMAQVSAHILRRLEGGFNNGGFVPWYETGFFAPHK